VSPSKFIGAVCVATGIVSAVHDVNVQVIIKKKDAKSIFFMICSIKN
jgi:hypothetical protein